MQSTDRAGRLDRSRLKVSRLVVGSLVHVGADLGRGRDARRELWRARCVSVGRGQRGEARGKRPEGM